MKISKAFVACLGALLMTGALSAHGESDGCSGSVAAAGSLSERLGRALGWRSRDRMWATAVLETGRPGLRKLLVYVAAKDVDLRPIPKRYRGYFTPFAFSIDLEEAARRGWIQIIREDDEGTTVRLHWHAIERFPSRATDAAAAMDLEETREHHHALAREAMATPNLLGWFRSTVKATFRAQLDFRLVPNRVGMESVEAVVVEAAVPADNGSWVWVAKSTDR